MSIFKDSISIYGRKATILHVAEELSELSAKLIKYVRLVDQGDPITNDFLTDLCGEWADSENVMSHMKHLFPDLVKKKNQIKEAKIDRHIMRMDAKRETVK